MTFELNRSVQVTRDRHGHVSHLGHPLRPYFPPRGEASSIRELADAYLHDVADYYKIESHWLDGLKQPRFEPVQFWSADRPSPAAREEEHRTEAVARVPVPRLQERLGPGKGEGVRLRIADAKEGLGTRVLSYVQTFWSLPIWEAGFTVTIQAEPLRVTGSQSSLHFDVHEPFPHDEPRRFFALILDRPRDRDLDFTGVQKRLSEGLGSDPSHVRINAAAVGIYRYDEGRLRKHAEEAERFGVRLPAGDPELASGQHALVFQFLITLRATRAGGPLNWRVFAEGSTGKLVYLQSLSAAATGLVYATDPLSSSGDPNLTHAAPLTDLNRQRTSVTLTGLTVPVAGARYELAGPFITLSTQPPNQAAPPSDGAGRFDYDVTTTDFAAVNAYHHCDSFFRLVNQLGFNPARYFDGTAFPVSVLHWLGGNANACMHGNATGDGCERFEFGTVDPAVTIGLAADARVVAHEFAHAVLIDAIHDARLAFAHSFGDSLAAIHFDPDSIAPNGALTFPWVPHLANREHQRDVRAGWSWGGAHDDGDYESEQVLSSTLFRLYQSLGGGARKRPERRPAADLVLYLLFRAVGLLPVHSLTPTGVEAFADALMAADIGTRTFQGQPGGAAHKVIRWSFERQGLYRSAGAIYTKTPGDPPDIDVYLDDGRLGAYDFAPGMPVTQDVWNRCHPDGRTVNEPPLAGQANYLYVRVRNRGTQPAAAVVVIAYQSRPNADLADLQWPRDWQALNSAGLAVPGNIPSGRTGVAGPISWTPQGSREVGILVSVSADGDPSNIDPGLALPCTAGPIATDRLVRWDNNLGVLFLRPSVP